MKEKAAELVSIVIPVYNEAANLEELIRRCLTVCDSLAKPYEIILVDDGNGGSDALITEAAEQKHGNVIGVILNRNYGQHAAVMAGFSESRGGIVVTLDADLQNPPEEIPKLIQKIEEGADVVAPTGFADGPAASNTDFWILLAACCAPIGAISWMPCCSALNTAPLFRCWPTALPATPWKSKSCMNIVQRENPNTGFGN